MARLQDLANHRAAGIMPGVHRQIGQLTVNRLPDIKDFLQPLPGVFGLKQWAVGVLMRPFELFLD